ncbi:MAG: tetratricopeptide repeat protein [Anaerolineales bacterium]|nr:tetratricopeptide repeat protein [Anaerolineales bacterium]
MTDEEKDKGENQVSAEDGSVAIGGGVSNATIRVETHHHHPAPEKRDSIGYIEPFAGETYIPRGEVEREARDFLRKGGTGAVVGLHAPGGLGKTEFAKHAAEDLKKEGFAVLWVFLGARPLTEVVGGMLRDCGVQIPPNADYEAQKSLLRGALTERRYLVVFDDLREAAVNDLRELLPPPPSAALITSRVREIGAAQKTFALDKLNPKQARALLKAVLGAKAVNAERQAAEQLAERCAFNPLALEIAAKRIRQDADFKDPIRAYVEKLQKKPLAHLKMHGDQRWDMTFIFDLSYDDLDAADQQRFRALAVFAASGFSPAAAASLWNMDEDATRDLLRRFQNLSLILALKGDAPRYRLHDLLDEYAAEKLRANADEERAAFNGLGEWLLALFDEHELDNISNAPEVGLEFDNLARGAEWARTTGQGALLARLATAPRNWLHNYFRQNDLWLSWLEESLRLGVEDARLKANVLQAIGDVQQFRDDRDAALASYDEALKLFRQVGAKLGEANVYLSLGSTERENKNFSEAKRYFENAFQIYVLIGDQYSQARALYRLGDCLCDEERYKDAIIQYEEAIQLWTVIGVTDLIESILKPRIEKARRNL